MLKNRRNISINSVATAENLLNNSGKDRPGNPHRMTSREHIDFLF